MTKWILTYYWAKLSYMIPTSSSSSPVVQPTSCEAISDQSPAFLSFEIGMRTKETVNAVIIWKENRNEDETKLVQSQEHLRLCNFTNDADWDKRYKDPYQNEKKVILTCHQLLLLWAKRLLVFTPVNNNELAVHKVFGFCTMCTCWEGGHWHLYRMLLITLLNDGLWTWEEGIDNGNEHFENISPTGANDLTG